MSPYRVQYTESESDIKNYNFLFENTKKVKILSICLKMFGKFQFTYFQKILFYLVLCIRSKIHIFYSFVSKIGKIINLIFSKTHFFIWYYVYVPQFIFYNFYIFLFIYIFIQLINLIPNFKIKNSTAVAVEF